jgi:hypothetical protein
MYNSLSSEAKLRILRIPAVNKVQTWGEDVHNLRPALKMISKYIVFRFTESTKDIAEFHCYSLSSLQRAWAGAR